jgi:hypothetical protein
VDGFGAALQPLSNSNFRKENPPTQANERQTLNGLEPIQMATADTKEMGTFMGGQKAFSHANTSPYVLKEWPASSFSWSLPEDSRAQIPGVTGPILCAAEILRKSITDKRLRLTQENGAQIHAALDRFCAPLRASTPAEAGRRRRFAIGVGRVWRRRRAKPSMKSYWLR